jgi:hypothetical protein
MIAYASSHDAPMRRAERLQTVKDTIDATARVTSAAYGGSLIT